MATGDFPEWRRVAAVAEAARGDLLSVGGVFATAVVLALANEISPSDTNASVAGRTGHAVIVVAIALAVLVGLDVVLRAATYRWTSGRRWEVTTRREGDATRLLVRSRDRTRQQIPPFTEVRVAAFDGSVTSDRVDPNLFGGGGAYPVEPGAIAVRDSLAPGSYEVRVYSRPDGPELIRRSIEVDSEEH